MNPLDPKLTQGTFGELLVQLRLFQYDVQAAPPLKDTGNDLIAIKDEAFKAVQVKTVTYNDCIKVKKPKRKYHIMALVVLDQYGSGMDLHLDSCNIYLIPKSNVKSYFRQEELLQYSLSQDLIKKLFFTTKDAEHRLQPPVAQSIADQRVLPEIA